MSSLHTTDVHWQRAFGSEGCSNVKKTENRFARETLVLIPLARTDHVKRSYIPKLLESRDAMIEEMEKKKKKKKEKGLSTETLKHTSSLM